MLTSDEKDRIRTEEIFRQEVRRELEAGKPRPSRREGVWAVLNSSFALWFLSSVILASFTATFTSCMAQREEKQRKADLEQRLDVEISNRIDQALAGVRIDGERLQHGYVFTPDAYYTNVGRYLNNTFLFDPSNQQDFSSYPEFRSRGFRSLIFELQTIVDPREVPSLKRALVTYETLADLGSVSKGSPERATSLRALKNAARLLENLRMPRWSPSPHKGR